MSIWSYGATGESLASRQIRSSFPLMGMHLPFWEKWPDVNYVTSYLQGSNSGKSPNAVKQCSQDLADGLKSEEEFKHWKVCWSQFFILEKADFSLIISDQGTHWTDISTKCKECYSFIMRKSDTLGDRGLKNRRKRTNCWGFVLCAHSKKTNSFRVVATGQGVRTLN